MRKYIALASLLAMCVWVSSAEAETRATVIDRVGNRFEVSKLKYRKHDEFSFSAGPERKVLKLREIRKITFKGEAQEAEQPIDLILTNGKTAVGTISVGGTRQSEGAFRAYGPTQITFSGVTKLGRFVLPLRDTKEVILYHDTVRKRCPVGDKVFEEEGYRFCPHHGVELVPDTTKGDEKN